MVLQKNVHLFLFTKNISVVTSCRLYFGTRKFTKSTRLNRVIVAVFWILRSRKACILYKEDDIS